MLNRVGLAALAVVFGVSSIAYAQQEQEGCQEANGSCLEAHGGLGCACSACCQLVCALEPSCCEVEWNSACVDLAVGFCVDCNATGIPDMCDAEVLDCNNNSGPDWEEGPTFCPDSLAIPVDLIVIAVSSTSESGKMPELCEEVFRAAVARLEQDRNVDVRAAWTSIVSSIPNSDCHDFTIPLGTEVPVCYMDSPRDINSNEDWGDATAIMTTPYEDGLLGQLGLDERDAVLILIPISDEGPQNGDEDRSMWNLIRQARIQNAQVLPMPTDGIPECVYESNDPTSLMSVIARKTVGSVVDARNWNPDSLPSEPESSEALSQELEAAIRVAIAVSPRVVCEEPCPGDFTGDGVVDGADFGLFLSAWGVCAAPCPMDFNGDGYVNGIDLGVLLGAWGPC